MHPATDTPKEQHMTQPDDDQQVRPFAAFLQEQAGGKTHTELSEALRDLVARVQDTGKKGTVTLAVHVEPMKGDPRILVIHDEIKLKLPEHDRKASIFFADARGNLTRDNPDQPQLPLQAIPNRTTDLKDAQ